MSSLSKDLLRKYVEEQNFKSTDDILAALKDMFCRNL